VSRRALAFPFVLLACETAPAQTPTQTPAQTPTQARTLVQSIDVSVAFDEGHDEDFGPEGNSVRAYLVAPAIGLRKKLFAVSFPYRCGRGTTDAGDDLVVQCTGDDGNAYASIRLENGRIVIVARDYGKLDLNKTREEIALPAGVTATVFAPAKYP
jgi:hypothetical protein